MKYSYYFSLFVCLLIGSHLLAQKPSAKKTVIRNVNVISIDAAKPQVMQQQDVIIEHGIIKKIKATSGNTYKGYEIVDGSGKYLIPGLADMHVHLPNKNSVFQNREFQLLNLLSGITTMRQMRGKHADLELRDSIRNGTILGCNMYVSTPFYRNGKTFSATECRDSLVKYKQQGCDFVKDLYGLSYTQYDTLVSVATSLHLKVVGHAPKNDLQKAVAANQLTIEHIDPFTALYKKDSNLFWNVIDTMVRKHLYTLPNLEWYIASGPQTSMEVKRSYYEKNAYGMSFLPKDSLDALIQAYTTEDLAFYKKNPIAFAKYIIEDSMQVVTYKHLLGRMHKRGVQFLISATSGDFIIPGYNCIDEMNLFAEAGIAPYDILKCATCNAAACMEESSKWGTITESKRADLVLLAANPLEDINNLRKVDATIINGNVLSHQYLLQELKKHYPQ